MKIGKILHFAMKNTFRKKGIALLAIVGIGIGVALQITLNSYSEDINASFNEFFDDLSGLVYVWEKDRASFQSRMPLNITDLIQSNTSLNEHILAISPQQVLPQTVNTYQDELGETEYGIPYSFTVIGLEDLDNFKKVSKALDDLENDSRYFDTEKDECIVPYELFAVNQTLFNLGKDLALKINDTYHYNLTIVGITAKPETSALEVVVGGELNIYTSAEATRKIMAEILAPENRFFHFEAFGLSSANTTAEAFSSLTIRTNIRNSTRLGIFSKDLKAYINSHLDNSYLVLTLDQALDDARIAEDQLTSFIEIIALVAVIAGGMGIVIAQLVGVESRMKEFAILKATGWNNSHILLEIVIESIFLGFIGSIAGLFLSLTAITVITSVFPTLGSVTISVYAVIGSILIAVLIGGIGGSYPGLKASSVRPIEILHGN